MPRIIKPIETFYNGYRFRSRTEARWAVYFDSMDIKYEYELEGFELEDGRRYLPDFWLPEFEAWVEVKPEWLKLDEFSKCFSMMLSGRSFLLLCGPPDLKSYVFLDAKMYQKLYLDISNLILNKCYELNQAGEILLDFIHLLPDLNEFPEITRYKVTGTNFKLTVREALTIAFYKVYIYQDKNSSSIRQFLSDDLQNHLPEVVKSKLVYGVNASRQARFEFGENGK